MAALLCLAPVWLLPSPAAPAEPGLKLWLTFVPNYIPFFPQKKEMNGRFGPEVEALRGQLLERNRNGEDLPCSTQILKEVIWLTNYTNRAESIERRLADLRRSLENPDQSFAARQTKSDGSWGTCFDAWFLRVHASADPIKELAVRGEKPAYRLAFLDPVDTPRELRGVLEDLLISNVEKEGINHRSELNLLVTGLAQLLFLPDLADMFPPDFPRDELAAALRDFMDNRWQDPETGYWGAWYEINGEIKKTNDLSITFHVISYRQDTPPRLQQMTDTTFAIRFERYPYGWRDRGTQNNHHAYDVVSLLRRAWPYMTTEQRQRTSAELILMGSRSLRLSLDENGEFIDTPYESVAEAYYFGVSFLDEIGFLDPARLFWAPLELVDAEPLREAIEANLVALNSSDPMAMAALRKLRQAD